MAKGESSKVVFKAYIQDQLMLLPPSLEELIPMGHMVRVVNEVVDRMDLSRLLSAYDGGGASRYHPRMLLKVLLYGYLEGIYSSRRLAKALRENVHYMWLSGKQRPDFRTLNRFRQWRLKGIIDEVFVSLVRLLIEAGLVSLGEAFVDGTKLEANANRYSFVWGKSVQGHREKLEAQVRDLLRGIESENELEEARYADRDLEEVGEEATPITAEQLAATVAELEARLGGRSLESDDDGDKKDRDQGKLKRVVKKLRRDHLPRLRKYEAQQATLGERNSFSKTDPEATFMRMKEDHMRNGQLKAGYNVQITTEQQFITNYTLHADPVDTTTLERHLDHFHRLHGRHPGVVIADAGYGSASNYRDLEGRGCLGYVKYNTFSEEQKRRRKDSPVRRTDFVYDAGQDAIICPAGETLAYSHSRRRRGQDAESESRIYEARDCRGCPLKERCCPRYDARRVSFDPVVENYHKTARLLLNSPQGKRYRSRRMIEAESVFAQIKHNRAFRRFLLRGLEKVTVEFGLIAMAHNLAKLWHTPKFCPA